MIKSLMSAGTVRNGSAVTDLEVPRPSVYMHAGQMFVSPVATDVITILGSCVAVCVYDPDGTIGGLNHFMLPTDPQAAQSSLRYSNYAVDALIEEMIRFRAVSSRLVAKIFGGACVLQPFQKAANDLGTRNIAAARASLAHRSIPVINEDVGGVRGRKLIFSTDSGTALVKAL